MPASKGRISIGQPDQVLYLTFSGGECAGRGRLAVSAASVRIGRGDDCDLILDGETVSRHHCTLARLDDGFTIQDCSRNGTFVNGKRIRKSELRHGDQIRIGRNIVVVQLASARNAGGAEPERVSVTTATQGLEGAIASQAGHNHHPSGSARRETPPAADRGQASEQTLVNHHPAHMPTIQSQIVKPLSTPHIVVKGLEDGVTQPFSEASITLGRRADCHIMLDTENISRRHATVTRSQNGYYLFDLHSSNGTWLNDARIEAAPLSDGDQVRIGGYTIVVTLRGQDCILNFRKKRG
ncbi:MAG: FHA domain-containing protein [Blastocatellia bacterium]